MKKRTNRKHRPGMHPLDAITACTTYPREVADTILIRAHEAYDHLKNGGTDDELFDRVAGAVNVGLIRAEQIGGQQSPGVQVFLDAQFALMQCDAMKARHGRYGFTGAGLQTMAECYSLYEEILRASSPRQMHMAMKECIRRINAGHVERPVASAAGAAHGP